MSNADEFAKLLKELGLGPVSAPVSSPLVPHKEAGTTPLEVQFGVSKRCPRCGVIKELAEFRVKQSISGYCKSCRNEYAKEMYELKRVNRLGKCPICMAENKLVLDHNHDTKQVREPICRSCNAGLGMFKHDISNLSNAIAYLMKHK